MKNYFSTLLLAAIIFVPFTTSAQVTIGSGEAPHSFSVLELISNQAGLRLPQMTTAQRTAMTNTAEFQAEAQDAALGLKIFNIGGTIYVPFLYDFPKKRDGLHSCNGDISFHCLETNIVIIERSDTFLEKCKGIRVTNPYLPQSTDEPTKEKRRTPVCVVFVNL